MYYKMIDLTSPAREEGVPSDWQRRSRGARGLGKVIRGKER